MNKIASQVYKNLNPRQRIIASIEAAARGDETERRRLITSCPKKTYLQNDIEYSDTMEKLMGLAMAVEADQRECALGFFVALRLDPKNALTFLQRFADIQAAWRSTVAGMGIDPETMKKAGPPPSPIFELIEDLIPSPDCGKVKNLAVEMRELISPATVDAETWDL